MPTKPKKEPKPPVVLRYQICADGKHPYYFAARQGEPDPDYPERAEQECVEVYVNRVLHPQEDCYVFAQEKDSPNWNTEVWNTYLVRITGKIGEVNTYNIEKVASADNTTKEVLSETGKENENAH